MRITRRSDNMMIIAGDQKRMMRVTAYALTLLAATSVSIVFITTREDFGVDDLPNLIRCVVFPGIVFIGIFTVLFREKSQIIISKTKGNLPVKTPLDGGTTTTYPLEAVKEVRLRHPGNPYYYPKLSISLDNGEEIILSSDVLLSLPGPGPFFKALPLVGHVKSEQKLGRAIAAFLAVPYREIKGGDVPFGVEKSDTETARQEPGDHAG